MTERKPVGERADGGLVSCGKAANGKEQEVLLRLEAGVADSSIAFLEEAADEIAQLREGAVFIGGDLATHMHIVSYEDTAEKMWMSCAPQCRRAHGARGSVPGAGNVADRLPFPSSGQAKGGPHKRKRMADLK